MKSEKFKPKMTIWKAGQKLNIPCKKEVLLSREDMKGVKPEYTEILIKTCIKLWIQMRLNIERYLEDSAFKSGIILSNWNVFHNEVIQEKKPLSFEWDQFTKKHKIIEINLEEGD